MRTVYNLNAKWAFSKEATSIPSEISSRWNFVNLPHCYNAIDGQDGDADYYRGTAYYAKKISKLDIPNAQRYYAESGLRCYDDAPDQGTAVGSERTAEHHRHLIATQKARCSNEHRAFY